MTFKVSLALLLSAITLMRSVPCLAQTGRVISSIFAAPGTNGTAVITWNTDVPSSSSVSYGTQSRRAQSAGQRLEFDRYTAPLTQTTSYWVRMANAAGAVDSSTATVTVTTSTAQNVPAVPMWGVALLAGLVLIGAARAAKR
jgi:hypothetical protein